MVGAALEVVSAKLMERIRCRDAMLILKVLSPSSINRYVRLQPDALATCPFP